MILSLDDGGVLQIEDPLDCRAFSFREVRPRADCNAVKFDGDRAWVSEAALRAFPPLAANAQWQADLGAMIAYASTKGWVDAENGRIRAHIETT